MLGLAKRYQVSTAHQMQMQGDATEGVLHAMVAITKGDNLMECVFSNHMFSVSYSPGCELMHETHPQEGSKVSLTGYSGPNGSLVVERWNYCSQAEHDARSLERVVFEVRKRKLKKAEETFAMWNGDEGTFLSDYNEDDWDGLHTGFVVEDEMVSDSSYNKSNDCSDPHSTPATTKYLYDDKELCEMLNDKGFNEGGDGGEIDSNKVPQSNTMDREVQDGMRSSRATTKESLPKVKAIEGKGEMGDQSPPNNASPEDVINKSPKSTKKPSTGWSIFSWLRPSGDDGNM